MIEAIAHPTDFSEESHSAFFHALRLALEHRCALHLLHVRSSSDGSDWASFPHVRETLARWNMLPFDVAHDQISARLGIDVRKAEIRSSNPALGIVDYLAHHRADLVVLASHGPGGLARWLSGSVSAAIAREIATPALFLGPKAQPFVDGATGRMQVDRILVPVAHEPSPQQAVAAMTRLLGPADGRCRHIHVGARAVRLLDPGGHPVPVEAIGGPVVESVIETAEAWRADLLVMATAGHHGFADALRGSTTERVLGRAPCPVLAVPARAAT